MTVPTVFVKSGVFQQNRNTDIKSSDITKHGGCENTEASQRTFCLTWGGVAELSYYVSFEPPVYHIV